MGPLGPNLIVDLGRPGPNVMEIWGPLRDFEARVCLVVCKIMAWQIFEMILIFDI